MRSSVYVALSLLAAVATTWGCGFPSKRPVVRSSLEAPAAPADTSGEAAGRSGEPVLLIYPEEYMAHQSYLKAIGGQPGAADTTTIEGTLMSVSPGEVCPYQEEPCSIEPYPSHWGLVRIDRIISYARRGDSDRQTADEQAGPAEASSGQAESGYAGSEQQAKPERFSPLEVGQEVEAIFVLTVSPAKVRYVPVDEARVAGPITAASDDDEQTAAHQTQPGLTVFQPIRREGGSLVFTTRVGDYEETVEKALPGLQVGSRFRALVKYDGVLYVEEYELIP